MKIYIKKWSAALLCLALFGTLTACGHEAISEQGKSQSTEGAIKIDTQQENTTDEQTNEETTASGKPMNSAEAANQKLIKEQTFEVTLSPLGDVIFASYEPNIQMNSLADVRFEIQKDGKTIELLEGMEQDNNRLGQKFNKVEAVSFPDYNNDGFNDIIIICSYVSASGTVKTEGYSEARVYSGNKDGGFSLERELTDNANSAVAEKDIKSILGFLGVGRKEVGTATDDWQQAYIDFVQSQDASQWQGYNLIYIDNDEIPELVEIGTSEAVGCCILTYSNGAVNENQLSRLYFTYIERENLLCNSEGNMDHYYDLVYRIKDGVLNQIGAGYYGVADNASLELDENGAIIYQYEWNGTVMPQEQYDQELNTIYDTTKAKEGYTQDGILTKDEVIQAIMDK